ncbi:MAG: T9SS C-terminal target domain-containing protein [Balneolaceae bacterium]|nr:MAG: T9SS C-terminal target domain-containing protein [Balneolaceae bacterium]
MKSLLFTILLATFLTSTLEAQFAGGSGTREDPYQIASTSHLDQIRNHLDRHFVQVQNFDAGAITDFFPIGDFRNAFRGTYDGAGRFISNLTITYCPVCGVAPSGLFGVLDDGVIKNVTLSDVNIKENDITGSLVGFNKGQIINCSASGDLLGKSYTGGLVGYNEGKIIDSRSAVTVSGEISVGGLVGYNKGTIRNSYASGSVTGDEETGGLVGSNLDRAVITTSYASGQVAGNDDAGGFAGYNGAVIESGYWDVETSGKSKGIGTGNRDGVQGLTSSQMTGVSAYHHMSDFDFKSTWLLTENYPALHWENVQAIDLPTNTERVDADAPVAFELRQNYPNPFNPATQISFSLPEQSHVRLDVYSICGRRVSGLINGQKSAGWHRVTFDATAMSSGIYLYRLTAGGYTQTRKMLLVR